MVCSDLKDLKDLKNELLQKIQDEDFLIGFMDELQPDQVLWASGPSFTIVPLELEMSGVKPAKTSSNEPKNKKNATKNYLLDSRVLKIEVYNANATLHEVELFRFSDDRVYSLRKNKYGEITWLKAIELVGGEVLRGCRVDADMEYWAYRYSWSTNKVREIVTLASNSLAGVIIKAEYDFDGAVDRLFFTAEGKDVDIYP
ncbi:hypothetical protein [Pseudomonas agarici]|uniref:hypothetical protein n=2 Tax=Pseudomonas agarici TaxID=46677 RepID=UPI0008BF4094|nr:hypothetical protein [Pseudomonas agarici]NWB90327.1 hypothetical protein [Pseudomonas agarici]NWC08774.1 hypothetical protein [Pseudomonas agarici]SEK57332.1 hypothetical protein SAMN05216604_104102 [Pseudomonas agarici]